MANAVFSPKNFRAYIVNESTNGTTPTLITGNVCKALDVDSVGFPSLNVTQVMEKRSSSSKIFNTTEFFQDNKFRTVEVSLAGTLHKDSGHIDLLENAMYSSADPLAIGYDWTGASGKYGTSTVSNGTFSLILESPDQTDGYNIVLSGCMVTNFAITADMGTDGGAYKWSATISSGKVPALDNTATLSTTAFSGSPISLATATTKKVYSIDPIMSSFGLTIDSPAVYAGVVSTGHENFGHGAELSVTAEAVLKLDSLTRGLPNSFDTQSSHDAVDAFTITQSTASDFSISMPSAYLTDVSYNEGDIMMLNVGLKAVGIGSGNILTVDVA